MTIRYFNATVGATLKNGDIAIESKGKGVAQANHVSLAYDDAAVTTKNQLLAALRSILLSVQSDSSLT